MSALHKLFGNLVDYAGLFPPAALPLPSVIKNYEKYVPGSFNWMLARLIVPASRLEEFAGFFEELFPQGLDQPPWLISALIPPVNAGEDAFESALQAIDSFNDQHEFANVDTVEGKLPSGDLIDETVARLPEPLSAFLEIPHTKPDETIAKLAECDRPHTFGKIRTGGVTTDLIPSPEQVANFIVCCAESDLGFKATAGLHHPLRGEFPLTYQTDSDRGMMHGFVNVFLGACLARHHGWTRQQLVGLLVSSNPASFLPGDEGVIYESQSISIDEIESTRKEFALSFGSCSFVEPVEELIQLGWLADAAKTI